MEIVLSAAGNINCLLFFFLGRGGVGFFGYLVLGFCLGWGGAWIPVWLVCAEGDFY